MPEGKEIIRGVRTSITLPDTDRGRSLDERLFVRFPALLHALLGLWFRLPPRSRLRQAGLARLGSRGAAAGNRRDFEVLVLFVDPDCVYHAEGTIDGLVPPDMQGVHHGHEGYVGIWKAGIEAWPDMQLDPEEVIDFGERLLAIMRLRGHGGTTGIALDSPLFQVFTLRRGMIVRQEDFGDRDKAFAAAAGPTSRAS
jgi:SnoaL-like domain